MKVAMVKHTPCGQVFWFEVPDHLEKEIEIGTRVACDTSRGRRYGIVVGTNLNAKDVKEVMEASGATFPLCKITATTGKFMMADIKIPEYMARSKPRDEKIAKRFLEYYHTGQFNTNVAVNRDGVLLDGYSAYLVAKCINLACIPAVAVREG